MKTNWKDVGIRSLKTFIQVFIPMMISAISGISISDGKEQISSYLYGTLISAAAAGIAAVWNGVIIPLLKLPANEKEEDSQDDESR